MNALHKTVAEIEAILKSGAVSDDFLNSIRQDKRKGVIKALTRYRDRERQKELESKRLKELLQIEEIYFCRGYNLIAGVDEAGRGSLAGPVVTAAVILPRGEELFFQGLKDSKKISTAKRDELYEIIMKRAVGVSVAIVDQVVIDRINIHRATLLAMKQSLEKLSPTPEMALIDGFTLPESSILHEKVLKGDSRSLSIAAASVMAKVTRDRLMEKIHTQYPAYNFQKNKGYPTSEHKKALLKLGPSPVHRRSFIKKIFGG